MGPWVSPRLYVQVTEQMYLTQGAHNKKKRHPGQSFWERYCRRKKEWREGRKKEGSQWKKRAVVPKL